ncbi:MAG: lysophospholipid acyltransferase family protein [Planctomycetota bacterium]
MISAWVILGLAAAGWVVLIVIGRWLGAVGFRDGDLGAALTVRIFQVYARTLHTLRTCGNEFVPPRTPDPTPGQPPLIVVCNHTAGVDPVLVQAALPFEIRWIMAEDMRARQLEWFWRFGRVIFVDRDKREARSLRDALRHLTEGGVLGVFPEGNLERPPRHLLPFQSGIGFLVRRSGATVLPAIVDGTPQCDPAWASLARPSRSTVRFLPPVSYPDKTSPDDIVADLRQRFANATGWPMTDRAPIFRNGRRIFLDIEGRYIDEQGAILTDEEALAIAEAPEVGDAGTVAAD